MRRNEDAISANAGFIKKLHKQYLASMQTWKYTNRLINETSPYLLQHAHNPVDWFAWSNEALQKAKEEDKIILVSIGYAACHWCHVMEKESFEDEETAAIMNKYFVNIKIDREERPDLDHIYMDAVQAITGSGGWPLNVFLTPDAMPFYGGTYFPPRRAFNRISWKEVLESVQEGYKQNKNEIISQAQNLTGHIANANSFGIKNNNSNNFFSDATLEKITSNILASADETWGGFGKAPKFPQSFAIRFLLRCYYFTKQEHALHQALLSLDKMIYGGIYDQLGGGFARYSTDEKWFAPHFEKMLYDNALLITVLCEAYQLTKNELYADAIKQTILFIEKEMLFESSGFYSALDADSEGTEGKYYVWEKEEIQKILGDDAEIFCKIYDVSAKGNWEHNNILWLPKTIDEWEIELNTDTKTLKQKLNNCRNLLLKERDKRIKPCLDDKILLGWNALLVTALCKAFAALQEKKYLQMALNNIQFLEEKFKDENGNWNHTWKNNIAKYTAFLDDYSFLIQAYIHLQEVTGNEKFLLEAKKITEKVIEEFADETGTFFYFTPQAQEDIIVRKKEIYDGATPSGNAVMAENLFYLSLVFNNNSWREQAINMVQSLGHAIEKYPTSFGVWALLLQSITKGFYEVAVVGNNAKTITQNILKEFIPNKILQQATETQNNFPLLAGKPQQHKTLIYLCSNYNCRQPVETVNELMQLIKNE